MGNFLFNSLSKGVNSRQFMSALGEMLAMALWKPFWPLAEAQVAKARRLGFPAEHLPCRAPREEN